eukprot:TRINITY_DN38678_c0_g1_i1.p1 TRINITY_DN38678_c0_g1~~TRINITY_DN38678_c0_g1_i1.p1  ORF type:complete len:539 (-),score=114.45 TRINITY_DN38678_c0_g1_i1:143-1759(-)
MARCHTVATAFSLAGRRARSLLIPSKGVPCLHVPLRCSSQERSKLQAHDELMKHKGVRSLRVRDDTVYIVPASRSEFGFFASDVSQQALRAYLEDAGYCAEEIPEIRVVEALPDAGQNPNPFMIRHIIDALFRSLDVDGDGSISMDEFHSFCDKYGLLSGRDLKAEFRAADRQSLRSFGGQQLDVGEFKELLFNTGLVELRAGREAEVGGAYLVDDDIVEIVLKHWFSRYDTDGDGNISFREYCRLVADYQLPYAVSPEGFRALDSNGDGVIDTKEFRSLLMDAKILATGKAISSREDDEGLLKTWRALETSQQFLPPLHVHASATTLPEKAAGAIRFVCISDTHGRHHDLTNLLPAGDILLHAGDFTMSGELRELVDFGKWLKSLPFERKIVVAGNHDLTLDADYEQNEHPSIVETAKAALQEAAGESVMVLHDEVISQHGIRIYGSPWQPAFGSWAFNLPRGEQLAGKWRSIPEGVDVLLVHGPPMGRGDKVGQKHVGCADLLREIQERVRPSFCVTGHIHEPGASFDGVTHYVTR